MVRSALWFGYALLLLTIGAYLFRHEVVATPWGFYHLDRWTGTIVACQLRVTPAEYTQGVAELVRPKPPRVTGGCNIKGNHSRRGDKIYHLPGRPYYEETVPERMFCSEAEARAAGFRKSRAQ